MGNLGGIGAGTAPNSILVNDELVIFPLRRELLDGLTGAVRDLTIADVWEAAKQSGNFEGEYSSYEVRDDLASIEDEETGEVVVDFTGPFDLVTVFFTREVTS